MNQPRYPITEEGIKKTWYIMIVESFSGIKNEIVPFQGIITTGDNDSNLSQPQKKNPIRFPSFVRHNMLKVSNQIHMITGEQIQNHLGNKGD